MNTLKHIEINIGKACNNKCRFCMSAKSELWDIKFVKLEVIKEKLTSYASRGYKSVGYLGGDISIHPNILEIIDFSKKSGFESINVISNGMKFDDPEFAAKIVDLGVTRVNFSIHSHLPEVENYLIQVPGGLERKWKAVENFQNLYKAGKLKDQLSINIVVNSKNYATSVETALFYYAKMGVSDIRFNFMWLNNDMREYWDDLKFTYTQFIPYIKRLIYVSEKYNIRITFDTIPACIFKKIDPQNYRSHIKKYLGEEHDHIVEIDHINNEDNFNWKERKKDMLKTQFDSCGKCIYRDSCQGVWNGYAELFGSSEFEPISSGDGSVVSVSETRQREQEMYNVSAKPKYVGSEAGKKHLNNQWCYEQIEKGNFIEVEKEIKKSLRDNPDSVDITNLYGVLLVTQNKFKESITVYTRFLSKNKKTINTGNIYYNLSIAYLQDGNIQKAEECLEIAKKILGDSNKIFTTFYNTYKQTGTVGEYQFLDKEVVKI